jgi:histidinol-phosphate aminotransferase
MKAISSPARERWHDLFRAHGTSFSEAQASFVFFDAGPRHTDVIAALAAHGVAIKQSYPSMPSWLRISIGLPDDNATVRQIVADSLS